MRAAPGLCHSCSSSRTLSSIRTFERRVFNDASSMAEDGDTIGVAPRINSAATAACVALQSPPRPCGRNSRRLRADAIATATSPTTASSCRRRFISNNAAEVRRAGRDLRKQPLERVDVRLREAAIAATDDEDTERWPVVFEPKEQRRADAPRPHDLPCSSDRRVRLGVVRHVRLPGLEHPSRRHRLVCAVVHRPRRLRRTEGALHQRRHAALHFENEEARLRRADHVHEHIVQVS